MSVERRGTKALELWARKATEGYPGVCVSNMTTSWRDGLAFCALIHSYRPDLIDFSSLKAENILENNALAFRTAEQHLGIPALLDAEDMVDSEIPDRLSVLTYVSQYYQAFAAQGLTSSKKNNLNAIHNKSGLGAGAAPQSHPQCIVKTQPCLPPPSKTKMELKTDKMVTSGRGRREVCSSCHKQVFLAERLLVGSPGQLLHRTCFRCARCSAQLTLASYYETEKGAFCCETCPDEEPAPSHSDQDRTVISADVDTDGESDSEPEESSDSSHQSDDYSHCLDETLEDGANVSDTRFDTLSAPSNYDVAPKPRTIFLSQILQGDKDENIASYTTALSVDLRNRHANSTAESAEIPKDVDSSSGNLSVSGSCDSAISSNIAEQSFDGSRCSASDSFNKYSGLSQCDDAKEKIIDPPDSKLDTGQEKSGIVSSRVKIFERGQDNADRLTSEDSVVHEFQRKLSTNKVTRADSQRQDGETTGKEASKADLLCLEKVSAEKSEELESIPFITPVSDCSEVNKETPLAEPSFLEVPSDVVHSIADDNRQKGFENLHDETSSSKLSEKSSLELSGAEKYAEEQLPSAPPLSEQDYPVDLNPFGVGDDVSENMKETESHADKGRLASGSAPQKLIKVNLNPFDSDEEESPVDGKESSLQIFEKENSSRQNPFWSDDEEPSTDEVAKTKLKPPRPPPPTLLRNSTLSLTKDSGFSSPTHSIEGRVPRRKISAPQVNLDSQRQFTPEPPPSPTLSSASTPGSTVRLKKKQRRAPTPPGASPSGHQKHTLSSPGEGIQDENGRSVKPTAKDEHDEVLSSKLEKDIRNHNSKMSFQMEFGSKLPSLAGQHGVSSGSVVPGYRSITKSEVGEWRKKKGPAPPRPVPQKRAIRKLPMRQIQQELLDIDVKQTELERQGVMLETAIRSCTEVPGEGGKVSSSGPPSLEIEEMILQLFELVNAKNELFRRQTELMYLKREKRLEEEHAELEYQIRCLMIKGPSERTADDEALEDDLIARLVKVVEQRDEIINCLELDRLREAQEDESIASHMIRYQEKHIEGIDKDAKKVSPKKKKKQLKLLKRKKKKDKKGGKVDMDKDVDEVEVKELQRKKRWFR